ncbi:MAG: MBL fold metallo-hydrolase [Eubacterium sp.]|nr:MBL fold metallo-hydrolase [Eubacterium sp.]
MKRIIKAISIFLLIVLAAGLCFADTENKDADREKSSFEIYYLNIGEGDAAVVFCDGYAMMIDGGPAKKSDYIYSFLKDHGVERLDYVIASHPDADHIGGLSGALHYAQAGIVFCTDKKNDSEPFESLQKCLSEQKNRIIIPQAGDSFSLGSAKVTVLLPERGEKYSDNTSLVVKIEYGETSFLFTGDAEKEDEEELLKRYFEKTGDNKKNDNEEDNPAGGEHRLQTETESILKCTVLKAAHHGSSSSTTDAFLQSVKPEYAVISVGGDNTYGHPAQPVLDRLKKAGVILYRTDIQGTVHCVSDGKKVSFDVEKNASEDTYSYAGGYQNALDEQQRQAEKEAEEAEAARLEAERAAAEAAAAAAAAAASTTPAPTADPGRDYIANTNTHKFHYPSCSSVNRMKESNKWYFHGTRDELINLGYEPCGNCRP